MVDAEKEIDKHRRPRQEASAAAERSRNAENHAALLAAVGEMVALSAPARIRRISLYPRTESARRPLQPAPPRPARSGGTVSQSASRWGSGRVGWVTAEIIASRR